VTIHQLVEALLLGFRQAPEACSVRFSKDNQVTPPNLQRPANRSDDAQINPLERPIHPLGAPRDLPRHSSTSRE
jgi:hypothetical protein